jgi:hypothetical protein
MIRVNKQITIRQQSRLRICATTQNANLRTVNFCRTGRSTPEKDWFHGIGAGLFESGPPEAFAGFAGINHAKWNTSRK